MTEASAKPSGPRLEDRRTALTTEATIWAGVCVLGISIALTIAQETSPNWWNPVGHSLVVWLIIGVVAAHVGTFRQALRNTPVSLLIAVATYYPILVVFGHTATSAFLLVWLYWLLASTAGGMALAYIADVALRSEEIGAWLSRGVILGMILGAGFNTVVGIPFSPFALEELTRFPPPLVCALVGAAGYVVAIVVRCRPRLTWRIAITPIGLLLGWVVITLPGLLIDIV